MNNLLDLFLSKNEKTLDNIQTTCFDTRTVNGTWWEAVLTLNEEPDEDDVNGEGVHIINLNLYVEEEDGKLHGRYTLDFVVIEAGVNDRDVLELNSGATIEQSMAWFKKHYKTYDLEDVILPIAEKFFEQTNPLFSSL